MTLKPGGFVSAPARSRPSSTSGPSSTLLLFFFFFMVFGIAVAMVFERPLDFLSFLRFVFRKRCHPRVVFCFRRFCCL